MACLSGLFCAAQLNHLIMEVQHFCSTSYELGPHTKWKLWQSWQKKRFKQDVEIEQI